VLLAAEGTEVKALAAEGTEQLLSAFRVGALYAGDSLGVVAAVEKALGHLCDALQAKPAVLGGVLPIVVFGELLEVLFEDSLKGVRSALGVGADRMRRDPESERQLRLHTSLERASLR